MRRIRCDRDRLRDWPRPRRFFHGREKGFGTVTSTLVIAYRTKSPDTRPANNALKLGSPMWCARQDLGSKTFSPRKARGIGSEFDTRHRYMPPLRPVVFWRPFGVHRVPSAKPRIPKTWNTCPKPIFEYPFCASPNSFSATHRIPWRATDRKPTVHQPPLVSRLDSVAQSGDNTWSPSATRSPAFSIFILQNTTRAGFFEP